MGVKMQHLDDRSLRLALSGDARTRAALVRHLAEPCEACESFLAQSEAAAFLDGEADRILLAPLFGAPGTRRAKRRRTSIRSTAVPATLGLAASVLVALALSPPRPLREVDGTKGEGLLSLELTATAVDALGNMRRIERGERLRTDEVVLFRYRASDSASALLLEQKGPLSELEPLGAFQLEAGLHGLQQGDALSGASLSDDAGRVTFWLVASSHGRPSLAQAREALRGAISHIGTVAVPFPVEVESRQRP
jgi:hypothetical protein